MTSAPFKPAWGLEPSSQMSDRAQAMEMERLRFQQQARSVPTPLPQLPLNTQPAALQAQPVPQPSSRQPQQQQQQQQLDTSSQQRMMGLGAPQSAGLGGGYSISVQQQQQHQQHQQQALGQSSGYGGPLMSSSSTSLPHVASFLPPMFGNISQAPSAVSVPPPVDEWFYKDPQSAIQGASFFPSLPIKLTFLFCFQALFRPRRCANG